MTNRTRYIFEYEDGKIFDIREWPYGPEPQRCLHELCSDCHGTGQKRDGSICIHALSCPCPRCTPRCSVIATQTNNTYGTRNWI